MHIKSLFAGGLLVLLIAMLVGWPSGKRPKLAARNAAIAIESAVHEPTPPRAAAAITAMQRPHTHLVAVPVTPDGRPSARNAGMERALEEDLADPAWTADVAERARDLLAPDPALHIDALHCSRTFCRIRMTKPVASTMDWEAVDKALTPLARGETIFAAEREGAASTGYIYFAAAGSMLPVDQVHEAASRRAGWSP